MFMRPITDMQNRYLFTVYLLLYSAVRTYFNIQRFFLFAVIFLSDEN